MIRDRFQSPIVGDTVRLKTFVYSSNERSNVSSIDSVEIYYLDETQKTPSNPRGKILIETLAPSKITNVSAGTYQLEIQTNPVDYRVGDYIDQWNIQFESGDLRQGIVENEFHIYRDLWITSDKPLIYDIGFNYSPHRIIQGSSKYIRVDLEPFVPNATTMEKYYYYINSIANISMSISQDEGEGYDRYNPSNNVLFMWRQVHHIEGTSGFFFLDTRIDPRPQLNGKPMPNGIYLVQFRTILGESTYLSPQFRLQIYN